MVEVIVAKPSATSARFPSPASLRDRPVTSSSCSVMVTPSMTSPNFTTPLTSVRIGIVYGSHSARSSPAFTDAASFFLSLASTSFNREDVTHPQRMVYQSADCCSMSV